MVRDSEEGASRTWVNQQSTVLLTSAKLFLYLVPIYLLQLWKKGGIPVPEENGARTYEIKLELISESVMK